MPTLDDRELMGLVYDIRKLLSPDAQHRVSPDCLAFACMLCGSRLNRRGDVAGMGIFECPRCHEPYVLAGALCYLRSSDEVFADYARFQAASRPAMPPPIQAGTPPAPEVGPSAEEREPISVPARKWSEALDPPARVPDPPAPAKPGEQARIDLADVEVDEDGRPLPGEFERLAGPPEAGPRPAPKARSGARTKSKSAKAKQTKTTPRKTARRRTTKE